MRRLFLLVVLCATCSAAQVRADQLPRTFEANRGQTDARVRFLSRGPGYVLFLTPTSAIFSLGGKDSPTETLEMTFLGVDPAAEPPAGSGSLEGQSNYYLQPDPGTWLTGIPNYSEVRYSALYREIDVAFHWNQQQVEHDFIVHPGADPRAIRLRFVGARDLRLDATGSLVATVGTGKLAFHRPELYQEWKGVRRAVRGAYVLGKDGHAGFQVGHYDRRRDLLIDPVLSYSTFLTANNDTQIHAIAVDSSGSAYVTGTTFATNFPTQAPVQANLRGSTDAFVTKFSVAGNALIYSTYFGGTDFDDGNAIAVDSAGNAYVTGRGTPGLTTSPGAFMSACPGICNTPFVAKFLPDGSLGFSTFTGGSNASSRAIAVDSSGNSYITGTTASDDLPVVNPFQSSFNGPISTSTTNAFVQKLNATGTALLYSTYFGGSSDPYLWGEIIAEGIAVDPSGNIYIAGSAGGAIPVKNPLQAGPAVRNVGNAFISKFTPDGSALVYSTYLGGSGDGLGGSGDQANAIAADAAGNAYVTGSTVSADFPFSENAFQTTCIGVVNSSCPSSQVFALKLDPTGSQLLYSTFIGPGHGNAVAVDTSGNAYIAGDTASPYFPSLNAIENSLQQQSGFTNAFVTELDRSGNPVVSSFLGGATTTDAANGIALDPAGNVYIAGSTSDTMSNNDTADFPLVNPFQNKPLAPAGFVAKVSPSAGPAISVSPTTGPVLTLRNVSASTLAIGGITPSNNLAMTSDCGSTLAGGASCHMVFQGPTNGTVTIASNAPGSPQQFPVLAPVGGLNPYPVLLISNLSLTFGDQMVGTSSAPQIITLTNPGPLPVGISAINITGDYSKVSNCPSVLSGGSSCQIAVSFAPKSPSSGPGTLSIDHDSYLATNTIYLAGIARQDELSISTAAINFGTQYVGSAPLPRIVTLTNIWQGEPVSLTNIAIQGDFAQTNNCPALLPAGASCRITVSFVPTMNSNSTGMLTISHAGLGGPETVSLSGIGFILSDLTPSPLELIFYYVIPGTTSASQPVVLTNSGSASLTISSIATSQQFSETDNCSTALGPGASCVVNVAFSPVAEGTFSGTLSVFHTGLGSPQIMSLTGIGQYALSLSATQLDFGTQLVNASSTQLLFLGNNSRTATVAINSIAVTGDFQVTQSYCGTSLAPQTGCSLGITFTPTTTGTRSGTLSVVASDAPVPHVAQLIGIGTQAGAGAALRFVPVAPCRIADTRDPNGPFGGPAISPGAPGRSFPILSSPCLSGVPSTVAAYSLNVTAVPAASSLGYLTIWPTGQPQPLVSTLNSYDGRIKANAAVVPAGSNGAVSVYVTDIAHVILDINGYFLPASDPSALAFFPLPPCRLADTRDNSGPLGGPSLAAGQPRSFPVQSSTCNIPSTALAYSLNFTAVPHGALGYLTTWPTGMTQPLVSTLNALTGTVTANAAIVPAGNGGAISVYVKDESDVIIDINGYFAPSTSGTDLSLYTVAPCRILDTRETDAPFQGAIREDMTAGPCGIPANVQAVVLNATVVPAEQFLGYMTLWPDEQTQPLVSTLNAWDGLVTSNMAIVPTSSGGLVDAFATDSTQLIFDTSGYFASGTAPAPTGKTSAIARPPAAVVFSW